MSQRFWTFFVTSYNPSYINFRGFIRQIASEGGQGKLLECHKNSQDCVASGSYPLFSSFLTPSCLFLLTFLTEINFFSFWSSAPNQVWNVYSAVWLFSPIKLLNSCFNHWADFGWSVCSWEIMITGGERLNTSNSHPFHIFPGWAFQKSSKLYGPIFVVLSARYISIRALRSMTFFWTITHILLSEWT